VIKQKLKLVPPFPPFASPPLALASPKMAVALPTAPPKPPFPPFAFCVTAKADVVRTDVAPIADTAAAMATTIRILVVFIAKGMIPYLKKVPKLGTHFKAYLRKKRWYPEQNNTEWSGSSESDLFQPHFMRVMTLVDSLLYASYYPAYLYLYMKEVDNVVMSTIVTAI
jgi:hypothetical protein